MEQDLDKRFEEYVKSIDALLIEADNEGIDISQLLLRLAYLNLRRAEKQRGESFNTIKKELEEKLYKTPSEEEKPDEDEEIVVESRFKFVFSPTTPTGEESPLIKKLKKILRRY